VIESHDDGRYTVFLPSAPAAFSGMVHVVDADRVTFLDVRLHDFVRSIAQFGAGQKELVRHAIPRDAVSQSSTVGEAGSAPPL